MDKYIQEIINEINNNIIEDKNFIFNNDSIKTSIITLEEN
jgi:hypothetical protein